MHDKNHYQKSIIRYFESKNQLGLFISYKRNENRKSKTIVETPHPFLKWAGGKRQLISQLDEFIPLNYNKYIEPFVGGGALFFYLLPSNAILVDNNLELINCYRVIKENVENLIFSLEKHKYEKEYYYKIRSMDRNPQKFMNISDIEKASRTIFLNK
ncbi:MAG: DNA adenine methylase, partial [Promethearchaeota archaeon]